MGTWTGKGSKKANERDKKREKKRGKITTVFGPSSEREKKDNQETASNENNSKSSKRAEENKQQTSPVSTHDFKQNQQSVQISITNETEQRTTPSKTPQPDPVFTMRFHIFIPPEIRVDDDFKVGIFSSWCEFKHEKMTRFKHIE